MSTPRSGGTLAPLPAGYSRDRVWSVAIEDLSLGVMSITPLEFEAHSIEVILINDHTGDGARVAIYTDSLSSADVLSGELPPALFTRVIHSEIAALPEFRAAARAPTLATKADSSYGFKSHKY